ncbi:MAG: hypothetical protein ACRDOB_23165, partial [Streptosporangiaceae bacterium]
AWPRPTSAAWAVTWAALCDDPVRPLLLGQRGRSGSGELPVPDPGQDDRVVAGSRAGAGPGPVDLVTVGAENSLVLASGACRPQFPQNTSLSVSGVLQYVHVPAMTLLP